MQKSEKHVIQAMYEVLVGKSIELKQFRKKTSEFWPQSAFANLKMFRKQFSDGLAVVDPVSLYLLAYATKMHIAVYFQCVIWSTRAFSGDHSCLLRLAVMPDKSWVDLEDVPSEMCRAPSALSDDEDDVDISAQCVQDLGKPSNDTDDSVVPTDTCDDVEGSVCADDDLGMPTGDHVAEAVVATSGDDNCVTPTKDSGDDSVLPTDACDDDVEGSVCADDDSVLPTNECENVQQTGINVVGSVLHDLVTAVMSRFPDIACSEGCAYNVQECCQAEGQDAASSNSAKAERMPCGGGYNLQKRQRSVSSGVPEKKVKKHDDKKKRKTSVTTVTR